MPRLLDRMPIPSVTSEVTVGGQRLAIKANQIVVWITLGMEEQESPSATSRPFPALLDTGHNHTLSIREVHLSEWADLGPDILRLIGAVRERGQRLNLLAASIWIHPNQPRSLDRLAEKTPREISAPKGIAVYPTANDFPRLPILGLRAIVDNRLVLKINGRKREATLRTARRWLFE